MKKLDVPLILVECDTMNDIRKSLSDDSPERRAARGRIISYLERNRGARQYRHAPQANVSVNKLMRPLSKKFGPGVGALRAHWPEIVGDKWAALSRPTSIRGPQGNKNLLIEAKGPAAALLSANAAQILSKINQYLGQGSIVKLKIIQGRMSAPNTPTKPKITPENNVHKSIAKPHENDLQSALNALEERIKKREQE